MRGCSALTHTRHHTRRVPGVPGSAKRRFSNRGCDVMLQARARSARSAHRTSPCCALAQSSRRCCRRACHPAPRRVAAPAEAGKEMRLFHNFPLEKLRSGVGRSGVEKIHRLALVGWPPHLCVSSQCPIYCFCGESLTSRGVAQEVRADAWARKKLNTFRDFPSAGLPPHVRGVAHALHAGHGAFLRALVPLSTLLYGKRGY